MEISSKTAPSRLRPWPLAVRAPLADVAGAPGAPPGALGAGALAVGAGGAVVRYEPGRGWQREFLLSSSGSVNKANLRGVAWPEPSRAHAVGDLGAMWMWNAADDIWTADPGVPIGFEGNLMDVAFAPGDPSRGYAVGKGGALLSYGKSWDPEAPPPGFEGAALTSIAFAGSQAIVAAGGDLLVNDGGGWRVDASAHALLDRVRAGNPRLFAVAGLPDGGAVAAGRDIVIVRDGAGADWRFTDQPIPGSTAIAAAASRDGGSVRAIVSVVPQLTYPTADDLPEPDPNVPPPIPPPFGLPGDGYLLRETAAGWIDEQRTAFAGAGEDRPLKSDPVLSLLLDSAGDGWAVGGWSGDADSAGRGSSARNGGGRAIRERVRTAAVFRYGSAAAPPPDAGRQAVPMDPDRITLAVAGHAQCEGPCAELAPHGIGPDRAIAAALQLIASMRGSVAGPRALLYTGNRLGEGLDGGEARRYAELLGSQPSLPVFPALGSNDAGNGIGAAAFREAFAGFPAPLGASTPQSGISTAGIPGAAPAPGEARTHYAFDSEGAGGTARVVVIDNSLGSLAASDPHQNPPEPQLPWLESVLADARGEGIPVVVMGNRSLNTSFTPKLNVASDGAAVAQVLVAGGASAYLFDRPEENRAMRIPAGAARDDPQLRDRHARLPLADLRRGRQEHARRALRRQRRAAARDRRSARWAATSPRLTVRLIPLIEDLSLEATDGTLLRRSRPALFRGLGRRPRGGDRWGTRLGGLRQPRSLRRRPLHALPPRPVPRRRLRRPDRPRVQLRLLRPRHRRLRPSGPGLDQPAQALPRRQRQGRHRQRLGPALPVQRRHDDGDRQRRRLQLLRTGAGAGGQRAAPLRHPAAAPDRFKRASTVAAPAGAAPAAELAARAARRSSSRAPPPPPPARASPPPPPPPPPSPPPPDPFVPIGGFAVAAVPAIVPPPPPPIVRPLPPGGAPARTYQVEEKREEEAAIEESQAFSRYEPSSGASAPPYLLGLVLIAAIGAASVRGGPGARRRRRPIPAPAYNPCRTNPKESQMKSPRSNGVVAWSALVLALGAFVFAGVGEVDRQAPACRGRACSRASSASCGSTRRRSIPTSVLPGKVFDHCSPETVKIGTVCMMTNPYPLEQRRDRQERLLLRHPQVRLARRLPADRGAADRRRRARQAGRAGRRQRGHRLDRHRPDRRPQGPPRDERLADHDRLRRPRRRLAGRQRRLPRRPQGGRAGPGAAARRPLAGNAPLRDRLRQRRPRRLRRRQTGRPAGELPLRLQLRPGQKSAGST